MGISRREWMKGSAGIAAAAMLPLAGCVAPMGSKSSYLTQVLAPQNNNTVFHWLDVIMQQTRDQRVAPPRAAYNFAMPLVAGFLAVNGLTRVYQEPYGIGYGPLGANADVAFAAAFTTAASEVFQTPFLFERKAFFDRFPGGEAKQRGIEWGRKVGLQVVKMRTNDGSEASEVDYYLGRYHQRKDSLAWKPTGPFYSAKPGPAFDTFDRALYPGQGQIKPWTMMTNSQFRASDFYHPSSPEFAQEYDLLRRIGAGKSRERTRDESEIAMFWEDGPWGLTPPGHFLYIAVQVLQHIPMNLTDLSRAFALLGMTQCDASISAWDSKYAHDIIRPESAIRVRAPQFNNPDPRVSADPSWTSYIPTPNFPSYTSGHSTFGAAGATMTALIAGTDNIPLSGISPDEVLWPQLRGVTRHWRTLTQIAEENGMSRIYGGVHWMADHVQAMKAGNAIAQQAFATQFPRCC
ncbi:PAP2 superfamily protein [Litorimonas taeanensis]|uniref:PAP2 superfamily protein n=1 Tax=Litorimonas taeanensis TaxID=568099 RepID=A0A420WME7_9PROT|nr:vanadium-dependent haloperoxidase [Litorimonas taeanensis]RKQ72082.1 PAP2 superfamily protein [Litorimonas taeanensis]